jgi:uncharacterized protein YdeI (YjbR/CyaY-like superfamily)
MTERSVVPVHFFRRRKELRAWFEKNHSRAKELWIGYYKKGTGKDGVTYAEAVEEALCFGWIDGQVRSINSDSYANRYTPRRPGSRWSQVNLRHAEKLARAGRMHQAGLKVYRTIKPGLRAGYVFEERPKEFGAKLLRKFQAEIGAWSFFQTQAPSYRRTATFWVMSGRQEETRDSRLRALMDTSAKGRRIDHLAPLHVAKIR